MRNKFPSYNNSEITAAAPTTIYGNSTVCSNSIGQTYSIAPISFATNYTWKAPLGSHITANGITSLNNTLSTTSNTITVNFGTVNFLSSISVQANNNCGSGTKKYLLLSPCPQREAATSTTSDIKIYPNPTSGQFTISQSDYNAEISITNTLGQQILNTQTKDKTINLQLDKSGVYLIHIKTKQGIQTRKLIVTH